MLKPLAITSAAVLLVVLTIGAAALAVPNLVQSLHPGQALVLVAVLLAAAVGALGGLLDH